MNSLTLAVKSILRRKSKAIFLILIVAIASASVAVLSTLIDNMRNSLEVTFDSFGANILITPKSDTLALQYGGISVGNVGGSVSTIDGDALTAIDGIPERFSIRVISPKLIGTTKVNGKDSLIVGVIFDSETDLQRHWEITEGAYPKTKKDLLLGAEAARLLGLKAEGVADVFGADWRVAGILARTGGPEDGSIYADLSATQEGLGLPGRVSFVEISALCNACPIDMIVKQISDVVPDVEVTALSAIMKKRMETIENFARHSGIIILSLAVLTLVVVALTFSSAVQERTREIGILMAVGYQGRAIGTMFVMEAMAVCAIGSALGAGAGAAAMLIVGGSGDTAAFNPTILAATFLAFTVIGMAACVPPSLMASRVDPARALRSI